MMTELTKIRKDFEKRKISDNSLKKLYFKYNNIGNINLFLKRARKLFPYLNCGIASVYLQNIFGGEIIQGKYKGNSHTFLKLNNKIIDITADQYGGPKVYAGELRKPWKL